MSIHLTLSNIAERWGFVDRTEATAIIKKKIALWAEQVGVTYKLETGPSRIITEYADLAKIRDFALVNSELAQYMRSLDIADVMEAVGLGKSKNKIDWESFDRIARRSAAHYLIRDPNTILICFAHQQKLKDYAKQNIITLNLKQTTEQESPASASQPIPDQLRQIANDLEANQTHLDLLQELKAEMQSIKDTLDAALEKLGKLETTV